MKQTTNILPVAAFTILFSISNLLCHSEETNFRASTFGCISDGVTLNTASIQTAVNTISAKGGGSLHFYVGRYLTGTVYLKSNVTIVLHEGATLVGVHSIYDYKAPSENAPRALIIAKGETNVGIVGALPETPSIPTATEPEIIGSGVIQGNGSRLLASMTEQQKKGYLTVDPQGAPALISFADCDSVRVEGLMLQDAAGDMQVYRNCSNVSVARQLVSGHNSTKCNGLTAAFCNNILITDNFFDVSALPLNIPASNRKVNRQNNRTPAGVLGER